MYDVLVGLFFFFQAEDGIRDLIVTGVQTCALPICIYCFCCLRKLCWNAILSWCMHRWDRGGIYCLCWLNRLCWKTIDRKSTRLNSSHDQISYAVFCLKKKKN